MKQLFLCCNPYAKNQLEMFGHLATIHQHSILTDEWTDRQTDTQAIAKVNAGK